MIKLIKINGVEHPIRVSYSALKAVKDTHGKSISKVTEDELEVYETLLFASLKSGYQATQRSSEFKFKKEEMELALDDCYVDFLKIVPEFFPKEGPGDIQKK